MGKYLYEEPIRMPRGRQYGSDYWEVFSKKINRKVSLYSIYEYVTFLNLEMNPEVEFFCEQPLKVELTIDGKRVQTVFDFWVMYKNGYSELLEVKPYNELHEDTDEAKRSQEQIKKQELWCRENSFNYRIITDVDLYIGEYFIQNLMCLSSKAKRFNSSGMQLYEKDLITFLKKYETVTIKEIIKSGILPYRNELNFIAVKYYEGIISLRLDDRPIDNYTEVTLCQNVK